MKLDIRRTCRGFFPHYFDGEWLIASRRNGLYRSRDLGQSWERIGRIYNGWRRLLTYIRLVDRITDATLSNAARCREGDIIAIAGKNQRWLPKGSFDFLSVNNSPIDHKPFRRDLLRGPDGALYIAEYIFNFGEHRGVNQREPVTIYRCGDLQEGRWSPVYRFPKGTVRHVHALVNDTVIDGRTWVCTGDSDSESQIYYSDDGFESLHLFAADGQRTRTCDMLFTPEYVYWGVDSPIKQSGIIRKKRDGGEIEWLRDVPCPVYFASTNQQQQLFFTTCVEPGPSVKSSRTEIYASHDGESFSSVFSLRADFMPQYSVIHFPKGTPPDNHLIFYSRATLRSENTLFVGRLRP
jgi:hypothetical protein